MTNWNNAVPTFRMGREIPKVLNQTARSATDVAPPLRENINRLKAINPEWQHVLWSDHAIENFIELTYGSQILAAYQRINPEYGAARADLFRYLMMYRNGGIYLDLKSTFDRPIDQVIRGDEMFIVSQWRNGPGERDENFGLHKELADIAGGEYQQWHIIAAPGHPFLRRAIIRVLEAVDNYRPWRAGVGKQGVLKTTGPIPYTLALDPLDAPHKRIGSHDEIGLIYSIQNGYNHLLAFKRHYSTLESFVVEQPLFARLLGHAFVAARRLRDHCRAARML